MSQSNWLSQFDLSSPSTQNVFEAKAAELLAARKLKHLDFTMQMQGGAPSGDTGQGPNAGGAGGEGQGPAGTGQQGQQSSDEGDPQRKIQALEEEKNRHFEARKAEEASRLAAEQELQKFRDAEAERERAGNDELTNVKKDLEAAQATASQLQDRLDAALLDNAFLTENEFAWQNPARVLKLVDRDSVEIKDGEVKGVKEALKALATSDPYLLKSVTDGEGSGNGSGTPPAGQRTGDAGNGNRNNSGNGEKTPEQLRRKYSALRR